jgi:hypothetical protein
MDGETAGATMHTLGKLLLLDGVAVVGALLTGVVRVYLQKLPASVFSFVGQPMDEGRPTDIVNCFRKQAARKTLDVKVFDNHGSEISYEFVGLLVLKIFTLVRHVSVRFLQQQDGFTTPFGLLVLAACYLALGTTEFCLRLLVVTRVFDGHPIGASGKGFGNPCPDRCSCDSKESAWAQTRLRSRHTSTPLPDEWSAFLLRQPFHGVASS